MTEHHFIVKPIFSKRIEVMYSVHFLQTSYLLFIRKVREHAISSLFEGLYKNRLLLVTEMNGQVVSFIIPLEMFYLITLCGTDTV